ncbi:MAG: hypothetical protein ACI9LE_002107 [Paraglaciecola sp.]|jgi:hypothetical protein
MIDGIGDIQLTARVKGCGGVYRGKIEENYDLACISLFLWAVDIEHL